jgi:HlyD family secretion protein
VEALIAQEQAKVEGVDVAKPKAEDIQSAELNIQEKTDSLDVARKAHAMMEVNYEDAKRAYERAKGLLDAGAASQEYFDQAKTQYRSAEEDMKRGRSEEAAAEKTLEQAKIAYKRLLDSIDDNEYERALHLAEIARLQAQLSQLNNDLKKTKIRAPVSGPVLNKYVEDSRVLTPGTELLELGDMDSIEIESDILSEEVGRVRAGNVVELRGKALEDKNAVGYVTRIYPSGFEKVSALGVEQQRVKVIIGFENKGLGLRPGTSLDVRIVTQESPDALAVPNRAVFRHDGGWAVFVADGGKARLRPIEVGIRNDEWVEVQKGLTAKDVVVAEHSNTLSDGIAIDPIPSNES